MFSLGISGCRGDGGLASGVTESIAPIDTAGFDDVSETLDNAFRIDISYIDVVYTVDAASTTLKGRAELFFTMRPGQVHALFHFAPLLKRGEARDALRTIILDGERPDPADDADVRIVRFDGSRQRAFELRRDLASGAEHIMAVQWAIPKALANAGYPRHPGWIWSHVDDTEGIGNEAFWPTINSPEELARHRIELRIRDPQKYVMIGSGAISRRSRGDVQMWSLDTEREVSSYTVMVAAMPRGEVCVRRFDVNGLPVTIASTEEEDGSRNSAHPERASLPPVRFW